MSIALRRIARGSESVAPMVAAELATRHNQDDRSLHTLSEYFDDTLIEELGHDMLEAADTREIDAYVVTVKKRKPLPIGFVFGAPLETETPTYEVGGWIDYGARGQGFGVEAIRKYLALRSVEQRPVEAQFVISATDLVVPARSAHDFTITPRLPYPYDVITHGFDMETGVPAGLLMSGATLLMSEKGVLPRDINPLLAALQRRYAANLPDGWGVHHAEKDGKTVQYVGVPAQEVPKNALTLE